MAHGSATQTSIIEGAARSRIKPDGLVEVLNGALMLSLTRVDAAAFDEGMGVIRFQLDGPIEVLDSVVILPYRAVDSAPMDESTSVIRIEFDGLVEVLDRLLEEPLAEVSTSTVVERSGQDARLVTRRPNDCPALRLTRS